MLIPRQYQPDCLGIFPGVEPCPQLGYTRRRSEDHRSKLDGLFVLKTPDPALARFNPPDQPMARLAEVGGGMAILRGIAAADVAAFQTEAQMHPAIAEGHALLADVVGRLR